MRVVALSDELEGEVLARSVCTASGQVLVGAGVALTRSLIARLRERGFTRGLAGREITLVGRMVAIADVFDAMTSDRVYRRGVPPHAGLVHLREGRGELYDASLVDRFCQRIAPYPIGTVVKLSTGELGAVVAYTPASQWLPRVRLFSDPELRPVPPQEIELAAHPDVTIAGVLDDYPPSFKQLTRRY